MKKSWVTKIFIFLGYILILFAFLSDLLRGRDFQFGWAQGVFFVAGLICLLSGWLFMKNKERLFFAASFALVFLFFAFIKYQIFDMDDFRIWTDTKSYVQTAVLPLSNQDFWFGLRPFLLPLIYKVFGANLINYTDGLLMNRVLLFQFGMATVAWMLLGYAFSRQFVKIQSRLAAVIITALLGLGLHASMWDKLLLSESISNSLFLLILAQVLLLVKTVNRKQAWWGAGSLLLSVLLFIAIRDANVYFVLLAAAVGLLSLFFFKEPRRLILTVSLAGAAVGIISFVLVNQSQRWWTPVQHVLLERRNSEQQLAAYFAAEGYDLMRMDKELTAAEAENAGQPVDIEHEQTLHELKSVYTRFLISHPGYIFLAPSNLSNLLNPVNFEYRYNHKAPSGWTTTFTNLIYPAGAWVYLAGLGCCLLVFVLNGRKLEPSLLVVFFLLVSAWPLALLIWHSDTMEIERHAQQLMIQSRIGFWFALVLLVNALSEKIAKKKRPPDLLAKMANFSSGML